MSLSITGKVLYINPAEVVKDKDGKPIQSKAGGEFSKREFAVEIEKNINGSLYYTYAKFETTGAKMTELDKFNAGDMVTVDFEIRGTRYTNKKTNREDVMSSLAAWRINYAPPP
ncbi:MAG: DUF3127 domain-containing protein, partial [Chitinophagia bacterium]|nr:DUF3127 domain-containing protein [Chitinophagia bacterium]